MNWLRRVRSRMRRPPPGFDDTVQLHASARIVNNRGKPLAIRVGRHSVIKGELLTFAHGGSISMGEYCFLGEDSHVWSAVNIEIGDRVLISHGVNIFDNATHPIGPKARHAQFRSIVLEGRHPDAIDLNEAPVRIEQDVLIGCTSVILSGVRIGEGAVIGAGSVVTRDVPPFVIAAGNPANVIRELTAAERQ